MLKFSFAKFFHLLFSSKSINQKTQKKKKWNHTVTHNTGKQDTLGKIPTLYYDFILTSCRIKDYFDWYQRWIKLKPILETVIMPSQNILNLGCGNSRLSEEMFQDGYENIVSSDVSETVINFMDGKCRNKRETFYCKNCSYANFLTIV
jgi:2-polyprenyl-3-methyl-5-hydroxy-6-metoxy-1,4-benzoquinol methylase